jgi:hypothetical protein
MANSFRPITNEDLIRKYDLDNLKVDRRRISALNSGLVKTDGILTDFVKQTTKDIEDIQDQLDGNITSWFYEGVPTLNNEPAVNWTTTQLKDDHLGDLYYDTYAGTAYRFIVDNNVYQWNLLRDDAAAQALSIARAAKDTADQKRRVFVVQPTPPYDVGDVWWNTTNGEYYRCIIAEDEQGSFHSTDWINDLKYTDDSTAIRLNQDLRADIVEDYATKVELTQSANSINMSVGALRVVTDMKHKIFDTLPTPPYDVGDYYIDKTHGEVYDCVNAKAEGESYASTDWVIDMELTEYVTQAGFSIFEDSINMEVKKKVNDNELITRINAQPGSLKIESGKIDISSRTLNLTSDNIAIDSDNFDVDKYGNVTCNNLNASNATVSGAINATAGEIGGCQITGNKLIIKDANIDRINGISADKIIGGVLNNNNNITIKNINGSNITGGTINGNTVTIKNLSASNISGGSLSAGQINYRYDTTNGQAFLQAGPGFAQHPYVSAINMAYGHGGISFRTTDEAGKLGSQQAQIYTSSANSRLYIESNRRVVINGVHFYNNNPNGRIYFDGGYLNAGMIAFGDSNVNANGGYNLYLNTESGARIYANGTRIGGSSDRRVKKNIKPITDEYKNKLLQEIRELPTYTYDFKENFGGDKDNLGIVVQDFENNEILGKVLHVTEYKGVKKYNYEDLSQVDLVLIKTLLEKIDKLEKEVKDLKEGRDAK